VQETDQNNLNEVLNTDNEERHSSFTLRDRQQNWSCRYWAFEWNECLLLTEPPKYKIAGDGKFA